MRRLLRESGMQRVVRRAAERGAEAARAVAPRRTGRYAGDITVQVEDAPGWDGRAGARIVARSPGALSIEFGTSDTPAAHALQAGITAIERDR